MKFWGESTLLLTYYPYNDQGRVNHGPAFSIKEESFQVALTALIRNLSGA
jgi:hypothetical protein